MSLQNLLLAGFNCLGNAAATADGAEPQQTQWWVILIYIVIFGAFIYFLMIRPQRKQKKQQEEKMSNLEPGSSVLTTSGFYGTIVAVNGDTVIVEFGNNKNCRIPMMVNAIKQVEKPGEDASETSQTEKKRYFGKKKTEEAAPESAAPAAPAPEAPAPETPAPEAAPEKAPEK